MKMGMKTAAITSLLTLGLMAGPAIAQTETKTTAPHQQMDENIMNGNGQGMMGKKMMRGKASMGMMGGKGMMMRGNMGSMKMMGQGTGLGMMGGGMMKNMSTENQHKFMNASKEMRKDMHMMRFEHMEAMRNPKTTLEDLATMEQKMLDTRKEMMKKAVEFQDQKN
jgi:hypothetical protein